LSDQWRHAYWYKFTDIVQEPAASLLYPEEIGNKHELLCDIWGCIQNIPDWRCKIIKFTVSPIGHHHPRSSSLPHVDTDPTVSPIFGTLPVSPLCQGQALSAIRPGSPQWYRTGVLSPSIPFLEIEITHRVPNHGSTVGGGDDSHIVLRQKLLGEDGSLGRDIIMVNQPGLFSPKFGATSSHVFTVTTKRPSRTRNSVWPVGTGASRYHNGCIAFSIFALPIPLCYFKV
jgi:hypothetical protein